MCISTGWELAAWVRAVLKRICTKVLRQAEYGSVCSIQATCLLGYIQKSMSCRLGGYHSSLFRAAEATTVILCPVLGPSETMDLPSKRMWKNWQGLLRSLGHTKSEQKLRELVLFALAKMLEQLLERMYKGSGSKVGFAYKGNCP